jgi:hypothetical protein
MATSAEGVQVNLPKQQKGKKTATKAPATLNQFEINPAAQDEYTAADEAPGCGWSNTGMWGLFAVGWIFLPCWWIGVVAGLRSGQDGDFLVKRRKKLTTQQTYAWWGCVIMSFVSAIILILALSIALGRKAPEEEGEGLAWPGLCLHLCRVWSTRYCCGMRFMSALFQQPTGCPKLAVDLKCVKFTACELRENIITKLPCLASCMSTQCLEHGNLALIWELSMLACIRQPHELRAVQSLPVVPSLQQNAQWCCHNRHQLAAWPAVQFRNETQQQSCSKF